MDKCEKCLFQTGWRHSTHCQRINGSCEEHVPGHLISRFGDVPWPPKITGLVSSCDFFVWGNLKECVYVYKPLTLVDLKYAIPEEMRLIDQEL